MKLSAKKPFLNLLLPLASNTSSVDVSSSNRLSVTTSSKLSILLTMPPISLIVYLRLLTVVAVKSDTLSVYGLRVKFASSIELGEISGFTGFALGLPSI